MTDWKNDISEFSDEKKEAMTKERAAQESSVFIQTVVVPAYEEMKQELEKYRR